VGKGKDYFAVVMDPSLRSGISDRWCENKWLRLTDPSTSQDHISFVAGASQNQRVLWKNEAGTSHSQLLLCHPFQPATSLLYDIGTPGIHRKMRYDHPLVRGLRAIGLCLNVPAVLNGGWTLQSLIREKIQNYPLQSDNNMVLTTNDVIRAVATWVICAVASR